MGIFDGYVNLPEGTIYFWNQTHFEKKILEPRFASCQSGSQKGCVGLSTTLLWFPSKQRWDSYSSPIQSRSAVLSANVWFDHWGQIWPCSWWNCHTPTSQPKTPLHLDTQRGGLGLNWQSLRCKSGHQFRLIPNENIRTVGANPRLEGPSTKSVDSSCG